MNVLYIQRRPGPHERPLPRWIRELRGTELGGQDGFFETSLCSAFPNVRFCYLQDVSGKPPTYFEAFDWVLINRKSVSGPDFTESILNGLLRKTAGTRLGLIVNNAEEDELPPAEQLEPFDRVFKREHLQNPASYGYPDTLLRKLEVTMISCPFVKVQRKRNQLRVTRVTEPGWVEGVQDVEVSFLGADTNESRRRLLLGISQSNLKFEGGLYNHKRKDCSLEWEGPGKAQQGVDVYVDLIRRSKVNLALPGYGGFTYRHLELWYLGAFMLTSAEIRRVKLPAQEQPVEGIHYIAFDSEADLIEKAAFYAKEEDARKKIAQQGRVYFETLYDFRKHGRMIANALTL